MREVSSCVASIGNFAEIRGHHGDGPGHIELGFWNPIRKYVPRANEREITGWGLGLFGDRALRLDHPRNLV